MIVTLVTFPVAGREQPDPAAQRRLFEQTAPAYREVPGLVRKYFIGNAQRAGGIYEWRSRADAEAWFTSDWERRMSQGYGAVPVVEYFDAPCIVDNENGRTTLAVPGGTGTPP
jgi:heme-degrading monooxygenase HmoA